MNKIVLCAALIFSQIINTNSVLANETTKEANNAQKEVAKKKTSSNSSDWIFSGQAALYYQTVDGQGNGALFDQGPASANEGWAKAAGGLQLAAANKNLGNGIGAGFELSGLSSLGLHNDVVSGLVQNAGGTTDGYTSAAVTQAYMTYQTDTTSMKFGRQHLPKSLSPFAYTEGWNVFKNSFNAALFVNSSLKDTALVYAYVARRNNSVGNLNDYTKLHNSNGAHMITAQNKSFDETTITASYYTLPSATTAGSANAIWLDFKHQFPALKLEFQTGNIGGNAVSEDTNGYGVKLSGAIGLYSTSFAYSSVDDGTLNIANLAGAGVKSPLYTQGVLNQNAIKRDSNSFKLSTSTKALNGTVVLAYMNSDLGATALPSVFGTGVGGEGSYSEFELIYKRQLGKNVKMFTALIHQNDDRQVDKGQKFFRIWFRYSIK